MSEIIKALIVDDEPADRESLKKALMSIHVSVDLVGMAENAQQALEIMMDQQPELAFIDIEMPGNDGFWLAKKIQKLHLPIHLIFVTAYNEYAIHAIRFAAFDFLIKPLDTVVLEQSMQRYLKERGQSSFNGKMDRLQSFLAQAKLKLITQNGFVMLPHSHIIYCEARGNYTTLYLADGQAETVCNQLGLLEEKLSNPVFIRVSRSVLININFLESYNRKTKTVVLSYSLQKYEIKVSSSGAKKVVSLQLS